MLMKSFAVETLRITDLDDWDYVHVIVSSGPGRSRASQSSASSLDLALPSIAGSSLGHHSSCIISKVAKELVLSRSQAYAGFGAISTVANVTLAAPPPADEQSFYQPLPDLVQDTDMEIDTPSLDKSTPFTPRVQVHETSHQGLGLFYPGHCPDTSSPNRDTSTSRSIGAGSLILSERPMLVLPHAPLFSLSIATTTSVTSGLEELSESCNLMEFSLMEKARKREMKKTRRWEQSIKTAYEGMGSDEDRTAYLDLQNAFEDEESTSVVEGVAKTNGLRFNITKEALVGVCCTMSRINHRFVHHAFLVAQNTDSPTSLSCSPNAIINFDISTFSFHLRACRTITPGEEITIAYDSSILLSPASTRISALHEKLHFVCTCARCIPVGPNTSNSHTHTPIPHPSDTAVASILSFSTTTFQSIFSPSETTRISSRAPSEVSLISSQGLESTREYEKALEMLMMVYQMKGDLSGSLRVGEAVGRWWVASGGGRETLERWRRQEEHVKVPWWKLQDEGALGTSDLPAGVGTGTMNGLLQGGSASWGTSLAATT